MSSDGSQEEGVFSAVHLGLRDVAGPGPPMLRRRCRLPGLGATESPPTPIPLQAHGASEGAIWEAGGREPAGKPRW